MSLPSSVVGRQGCVGQRLPHHRSHPCYMVICGRHDTEKLRDSTQVAQSKKLIIGTAKVDRQLLNPCQGSLVGRCDVRTSRVQYNS
jgi:hypothetical protein